MPRDKNGRFISKQQAAQQEQGQPVNDCGSGSLAVGDQSQLGASGAIALKDVPTTLPDVSPDALIESQQNHTPSEGAARLAKLETAKTSLQISLAEKQVTELGILNATADVRIARRVNEFQIEQLKREDSENELTYQTEAVPLKQKIRGHQITDLKARAKKWELKAQKADGYLQTVDAEYTVVGN
ncbi:MAG: hypothetical protein F6K41_03350 [Symploca sp. SIO3E6]|nr:hypothetical protein [Symploca sp. SIO2C1]NES17967.1 hypothetical protein [Caldora sp. SIO3E6]